MIYVVKHNITKNKLSLTPLNKFEDKSAAQTYINKLANQPHHGAVLSKKTKNTLTFYKQITTSEKECILIRISNNLLVNPKVVINLQKKL